MGEHTVLPTRGTSLEINISGSWKLLKGTSDIGIPGTGAPELDVTSSINEARQYITDLANPGSMQFTMFYSPADSSHAQLRADFTSAVERSFRWRVFGKRVNGIYTKASEDSKTLKASVTAGGKLTRTEGAIPQIGDYLVPNSGDTLIVEEDDYASTPQKWDVKKSTSGNIAAVSTAKKYTLKRPAVRIDFQATVNRFDYSQQAGMRATIGLKITGKPEEKVGTPDLGA